MSTRNPSHRRRSHDEIERRAASHGSSVRIAAQVLLTGILIVAPWTLGGVYAQTQVYLFAALLGCLGLWFISYLLETTSNPDRTRLPLMILPLVLGVVAGTLQLIPLPAAADHLLGPPSEFVDAESSTAGIARVAASVYPLATRVHLAKLSFGLIAFFLGTQLFAARKAQIWLFGAIAVSGLVFSFFGIAQKLSWNGHLFWTGPEIINGKPFASYVNRNNAAGYLNLTLAAAIGLLIWASYRDSRKNQFQYDLAKDGSASDFSEKLHQWMAGVGQLTTLQLLSGLCVVFITAGVAASASRGGILSLGVAALIVTISMARRGLTKLAGTLAILLVVMSIGLVTWLGISRSVSERFTESSVDTLLEDGRIKNWKDVSASVPEIWGTGSGLGTYRYFHRPYQTHQSEGLYVHAENQYVEALVEAGVWGLGLVVLALIAGLLLVYRLRRSQVISKSDGVAFVGMFALLSQAAHAVFDYGLVQPANMLLFAVLMGAVAGRAVRKLANGTGNWYFALPRLQPRVVFSMFALILLLNGIAGWAEIHRSANAEEAIQAAEELNDEIATDADYQNLLTRMLNVAATRPDDAHLQLAIADVYVRMYGYQLRTELKENTPENSFTPQQLAEIGSLTTLYRRANQMALAGTPQLLQALRDDETIRSTLVPARSALLTARSACGLLPQVETYLALLAFLDSDSPDGLPYLERAVYLAPYESRHLYYAGSLSLAAGRLPFTMTVWKRAYQLHHRYRYDIVTKLSRVMSPEQLLDSVIPNDAALLKEILLDRGYQVAQTSLVRAAAERLDAQYREENPAPTAGDKAFVAGYRHLLAKEYEAARADFKTASDAQPDDALARIYLIEATILSGDLESTEELMSPTGNLEIHPNELKRLQNLLASARAASENDRTTD